jgi:hypothetical protein
MLKYVSKFAMDILPSVAATIIGAYIVNHYIATKPGTDKPGTAAVASVDPKSAGPKKAGIKGVVPSEISADAANVTEPGVRAKGISEKTILERSAVDKTTVEKPAVEKAVEKPADKPAETASIPVETRRHQPAPREKTVARSVPAQPSVPVPAPVVAAPITTAPVEAAVAPEERRDANDLARAAIERLRSTPEASPRAQEAARIPDATRIPDPTRILDAARVPETSRVVSAPPVRPLPPPIMVSNPAAETFGPASGPSQTTPPGASLRTDDPRRPTPPADIPDSRPLDLHAEVTEPAPREHTTVTQDVLSAAKSVFHAVLPK